MLNSDAVKNLVIGCAVNDSDLVSPSRSGSSDAGGSIEDYDRAITLMNKAEDRAEKAEAERDALRERVEGCDRCG